MSSLGKWSKQGVPKKGWICIGLEDLGEPATECEMCENQEIRYVHQMQHPNYPDILDCGCVCAGKLEEDYAAASKRESDSKNVTIRRRPWARRIDQRCSGTAFGLRGFGVHFLARRSKLSRMRPISASSGSNCPPHHSSIWPCSSCLGSAMASRKAV